MSALEGKVEADLPREDLEVSVADVNRFSLLELFQLREETERAASVFLFPASVLGKRVPAALSPGF